jgi:hypothetical protein
MARENQGLHFALIIFVMLTIVLGVTTFMFFRNYEEAERKAAEASKEANEKMSAARLTQEENNELKRLMGFDATMDLQAVNENYAKDMQTYAANFPEENRFYSPVLAYLHTVIQEKNQQLAEADTTIQELKDHNAAREREKDPQIEQFQTAAAKAREDLSAEQEKFEAARAELTEDKNELAAAMQKARKEADVALSDVQQKLETRQKQIRGLQEATITMKSKLEDVQKETFEIAHGEIRWVNQRNGTVWINLGQADALGRQTTFSVYPADTTDVSRQGKKGSIEVIQILGDHLAEARIIEDDVSDPIMPGDKIHTPVWNPGEARRFALVPFMDIDGDGESEQDVVRNIITMNGGVIDAEVVETSGGAERRGKMTINTRYLVRGEPPTDKSNQELIKEVSRIVDEAEKLGVETISYKKLLHRMGWKNTAPVTQYGSGANPNDFRPVPPEGGVRTSSGNVSEIFKPRRPRAGNRNTAY